MTEATHSSIDSQVQGYAGDSDQRLKSSRGLETPPQLCLAVVIPVQETKEADSVLSTRPERYAFADVFTSPWRGSHTYSWVSVHGIP